MVAQDAAGIGVADQCRHLLICFSESRQHSTLEGFHGVQTCPLWGGRPLYVEGPGLYTRTTLRDRSVSPTGPYLPPHTGRVRTPTEIHALDWLLQPVLLDSTTSSCGCTFSTVKAESSGEDPRATGGLVSNLSHPWVNKTKQHRK